MGLSEFFPPTLNDSFMYVVPGCDSSLQQLWDFASRKETTFSGFEAVCALHLVEVEVWFAEVHPTRNIRAVSFHLMHSSM